MADDTISKLVSAVQFGDLTYVQEAVKLKHDIAQSVDDKGCSLLHWACINNRSALYSRVVTVAS
jgi:hypothetical protein